MHSKNHSRSSQPQSHSPQNHSHSKPRSGGHKPAHSATRPHRGQGGKGPKGDRGGFQGRHGGGSGAPHAPHTPHTPPAHAAAEVGRQSPFANSAPHAPHAPNAPHSNNSHAPQSHHTPRTPHANNSPHANSATQSIQFNHAPQANHQHKSPSPTLPPSPTPDSVTPSLRHSVTSPVTFASLLLNDLILRSVTSEGYTTPTPIQAQAIPHILKNRDMLGCAQTGTGKTAAFALPILHRLSAEQIAHPNQHSHRPIRALILAPTRELALQIDESFRVYGRNTHLRTTCVFGGVGQGAQTRALRQGVDILTATPGRLMDLMQQGYIELSRVEVFVLDEADRMLDMGFIEPIRKIGSKTPPPGKRQTLLFSATMPKEIRHLAEEMLRDPARVEVASVASTPDLVEQSVFMVNRHDKPALLAHFITEGKIQRALVFTRTKHGADRVAKDLHRAGISADAIHGNKRQNVRQRTLEGFRSGQIRVLVATDIAARGIDVDGITHVVNFDVPHEPETYVHRIGRTARAGAKGQAVSFCDKGGDERGFLRDIERLIRKSIPVRAAIENLPPPPPREPRSAHPRGDSFADVAPHDRSNRGHSHRPSRGTPFQFSGGRGAGRRTGPRAEGSNHSSAPAPAGSPHRSPIRTFNHFSKKSTRGGR